MAITDVFVILLQTRRLDALLSLLYLLLSITSDSIGRRIYDNFFPDGSTPLAVDCLLYVVVLPLDNVSQGTRPH
jgi:hypothetical protein